MKIQIIFPQDDYIAMCALLEDAYNYGVQLGPSYFGSRIRDKISEALSVLTKEEKNDGKCEKD